MQSIVTKINTFTLKLKEGTQLRELDCRTLINSFNDEPMSLEQIESSDLEKFTKKVLIIAHDFLSLNLTVKKELVSVNQTAKIIYAVKNEITTKSALKKAMELNDKEYKTFIKSICKSVATHIAKSKTTDEAIIEVGKLLESLSKEEIKNALALN